MAKPPSPPPAHLETLAVLALAATVAGLVFHYQPVYYLAAVLLGLGLFVKPVAAWISRGWLALARALGYVNSKILLTLIFYLFLTPLAWFYRLCHGDFLQLKPKNPDSYWTPRDHAYTKDDLEKLW